MLKQIVNIFLNDFRRYKIEKIKLKMFLNAIIAIITNIFIFATNLNNNKGSAKLN